MPHIHLKTKSPEFDDGATQHSSTDLRTCDADGCNRQAGHKAPKNRSLSEYYHFCYEHVCAYNKQWDFFDGMSARDIEEHIMRAAFGDRQTWRFANYKDLEDFVFKRAWQFYHFTDKDPDQDKRQKRQQQDSDDSEKHNGHNTHKNRHHSIPAYEALDIMGLTPPVDLAAIKKKYKQLVKQYHPDHNRDDKGAEETMKLINMAYATLKVAYARFENFNTK